MPPKLIRLRYAGTCSLCSAPLPAGTNASWDSETHLATCSACLASENVSSEPDAAQYGSEAAAPSPSSFAYGVAGGSAQREYEKRHQRREQRIEQKWGRLAGVVKFLSDDPQNITAWAKGSEGERRLAAHLQKAVGDRAILLNDRKVPKTKGNIDHLVIAASGIWVIDAKNYKGVVERRDVGGWFKTDQRLYVGRRDQTKLARGLGWQIEAVRTALAGADNPITGVLCFTDAEWRLFAKPFQLEGVWVTWAKKLVEMIAEPGPLTSVDVSHIAERLSSALPPEIPGP